MGPPSDDRGLIYDAENWVPRRYTEKNIRTQTTILKAKYEIPLGDLPGVDKVGEDLTLTPMVKYIWDKAFDHTAADIENKTYINPLNSASVCSNGPRNRLNTFVSIGRAVRMCWVFVLTTNSRKK